MCTTYLCTVQPSVGPLGCSPFQLKYLARRFHLLAEKRKATEADTALHLILFEQVQLEMFGPGTLG